MKANRTVKACAQDIATNLLWLPSDDGHSVRMAKLEGILEKHFCPKVAYPHAGNAAVAITWDEWQLFSKEKRHNKALTPTTLRKHIKFLESLSPTDAIASMEQSMSRGWTGLFPVQMQNAKPSITFFRAGTPVVS